MITDALAEHNSAIPAMLPRCSRERLHSEVFRISMSVPDKVIPMSQCFMSPGTSGAAAERIAIIHLAYEAPAGVAEPPVRASQRLI